MDESAVVSVDVAVVVVGGLEIGLSIFWFVD